jgi:hypothetical protein
MNPHSYAHLIFYKGAKNIQWRKDSIFNKCFWENWISTCRKLKLDPCLSLCISVYPKCIKDHNIRPFSLQNWKIMGWNRSYLRGWWYMWEVGGDGDRV